jgi:hypothetical protein
MPQIFGEVAATMPFFSGGDVAEWLPEDDDQFVDDRDEEENRADAEARLRNP